MRVWGRAIVPDDGRSRDTLLRSVEGRGQSPSMPVAGDGVLTSGWDSILAVGWDGVFLPLPFLSFPFPSHYPSLFYLYHSLSFLVCVYIVG